MADIEKMMEIIKKPTNSNSVEVTRIERSLNAKYAEFRRRHPIDRSQEGEINRFIDRMKLSIDQKYNSYKIEEKYEMNDINYMGVSSMRDPRLTPYKEKLRDAAKNFIEEMRRLFEETECQTELFYKKGISAQNLKKLVDLMEKICSLGKVSVIIKGQQVAKASLPIRYSQKVDKWKTTAREIPEDPETRDRENEAKAKKIHQAILSKVEEEEKSVQTKVSSLENKLEKKTTEVNKAKVELNKLEEQYDSSKAEIIKCSEQKIKNLNENIEELKSKREELLIKRQELEDMCKKTFALLFIKKIILRIQVSTVGSEISYVEGEIEKTRADIKDEEVSRERLILELSLPIDEEKKKLEKKEKDISNITLELDNEKKKLKEIREDLIKKRGEINSFHRYYLIQTYGGMEI